MTDTVLVTGGTGFVGRWCIVELLRRGYGVRTTVRDLGRADAVHAALAVEVPAVTAATVEVVAADLTADEGWAAAVEGCTGVLHVATPIGLAAAADPDGMVRTAREGTARVVGAAVAAGVPRVVMTSAANTSSPTSYAEDGVTDETLWTDPDGPGVIPYRRSKTLAEREAWAQVEEAPGTALTTVLPGAVYGPPLAADNVGSVAIVERMLTGAMPGTPHIALEVVDVRDLAALHVLALAAPEGAGERFLGTGDLLWMGEIAALLREHLGAAAERVPTWEVPDEVIRELAETNLELAQILPGLGRRNRHSTEKAERVLGWSRRPAVDTLVETARRLIELGVVD